MGKKKRLTKTTLCEEAEKFAAAESTHHEPILYGVTDGKAVGTYLEHKFREQVARKYTFTQGSSASGIDFPGLEVDVKVTSSKQPQSSCPYKTARQKIFGLGYSLLIFVYEKLDDSKRRTSNLNIIHTIFIDKTRTADYQMTSQILQIIKNAGNEADLIALMQDRNLPVDDIQAAAIAKEILAKPPKQGYLTISNALQWRLQYQRVINVAGAVGGVRRVR